MVMWSPYGFHIFVESMAAPNDETTRLCAGHHAIRGDREFDGGSKGDEVVGNLKASFCKENRVHFKAWVVNV